MMLLRLHEHRGEARVLHLDIPYTMEGAKAILKTLMQESNCIVPCKDRVILVRMNEVVFVEVLEA